MREDIIKKAVGENSQLVREINPGTPLQRLMDNIAGLEAEIAGIKEKLFPLKGKSRLLPEDQAAYAQSLALKEAQLEAWSERAAELTDEIKITDAIRHKIFSNSTKEPPVS